MQSIGEENFLEKLLLLIFGLLHYGQKIVLGGPKGSFVFFHKMALVALKSFNFLQNNFVRFYVTAVISACI